MADATRPAYAAFEEAYQVDAEDPAQRDALDIWCEAWQQATAPLSAECEALRKALEEAQRSINSMKVEAETAALICDDESVREHCETISQEGLEADTAIRSTLKGQR